MGGNLSRYPQTVTGSTVRLTLYGFPADIGTVSFPQHHRFSHVDQANCLHHRKSRVSGRAGAQGRRNHFEDLAAFTKAKRQCLCADEARITSRYRRVRRFPAPLSSSFLTRPGRQRHQSDRLSLYNQEHRLRQTCTPAGPACRWPPRISVRVPGREKHIRQNASGRKRVPVRARTTGRDRI